MDFRILPPDGILETTVALPLSKSINARAIVMAHLAGKSEAPVDCADTQTLAAILGAPKLDGTVDVGPAGTAMRFLTALAAATPGTSCTLTGSERMLRRPIAPLVDALRELGADIAYEGKEGYPPLRVEGRRLSGGTIAIDASVSSQFISALMMVAPLMESPLEIELKGIVGSLPYIKMTAEMMRRRGVNTDVEPLRIWIDNSPYRKTDVDDAEPDWSAAAFWYEIAALSAGWVTLEGMRADSIQGDSEEAALFEKLGVTTEFTDEGAELSATPELFNSLDADMSGMPDAVPALAVTACMVGVPFRFSGVGALHHKECDRLESLAAELAKLGFPLDIEAYGTVLAWDGRRLPVRELPVFDTYNDHRMAMALAPTAIFVPGIVVRDADVVGKSYPDFWKHLQEAGFTLLDPSEPMPEPAE
ncbi:MAG: 3-phosphoshikimate 1-carboxyvinyltransferase [Muribaculaceae bacterium]|nr:3-phosphoshikimate 1-carboxyvinyltransferase [Muribaculaceae bacterium]